MKELTTIKKNIVILLLLTVVFSALGPLTASAQSSGPEALGVGSIFADSAGCVAGKFLGGFVLNLAIKGLNALSGLLPNRIKSWFGLQDEVPIHNQKDWTKQHVLDLVARCGARAVLNDMTGRMIGAVRTSGRDGRASFVRDWRKFLAQGQYRGEGIFRSMLASTALCPHVSGNLRKIYKAQYQPKLGNTYTRFGNLDPYPLRARCTMPTGWNLVRFADDFAGTGGWNALVRLAEPQNNFYGSSLMSAGEVRNQRSQSQTEDIIEAITGAGMTSRRDKNPTNPTNPTGYCSNNAVIACTQDSQCAFPGPLQGRCSELQSLTCSDDSICINALAGICEFPTTTEGRCIKTRNSCLIQGINDKCLVYNDILTPGSVLGHSVQAVINNELTWVTSIDEMEELMSNLTRLLMNRILNLSKPDVRLQEDFPGELYPPFSRDPDPDPNLPNPTIPPLLPECNDSIDNDGDNQSDWPADTDCTDLLDNSESGGGGGGVCAGTGIARYESNLRTAMDNVINTNPGGIADQPNNSANTSTFFDFVITELQNAGLQGNKNVLNGNGNNNSGDLIAVWRSGDTAMDRYDAITAVGSGALIRNSTATIFTGQVPLSCTGGPPTSPIVILFSDVFFGGASLLIPGSDPDLSDNGLGDNWASSIQVSNATVTLFQDANFQGISQVFTGDFDNFVGSVIGNDTASSILISATSPPPGPPPPGPPPLPPSGTLTGIFDPNFNNINPATVLDYTTANLCVDINGNSLAVIRMDGADILFITSSDGDLAAGTRIQWLPPSGFHTYTLHDGGCGTPSGPLGSVDITVL